MIGVPGTVGGGVAMNGGPHGDFIFEVDFIVGELMKTLKELGVADNTLVMFSSDNGPETPTVWHMRKEYGHDGSHPWRGVKRDVWEGGHRVPLIAHWPGRIKAGAKSKQTISLVDIMATLGAITGATLPNDAAEDSFDFKDVLLGKDDGKPVREFTMQASWQGLSIRHGKWKYLEKPYKLGVSSAARIRGAVSTGGITRASFDDSRSIDSRWPSICALSPSATPVRSSTGAMASA